MVCVRRVRISAMGSRHQRFRETFGSVLTILRNWELGMDNDRFSFPVPDSRLIIFGHFIIHNIAHIFEIRADSNLATVTNAWWRDVFDILYLTARLLT
jgi:hypothetical protein